jgi:hypothetical protein
MSKQEEIDIIDQAIKKLGADSYLGPWLASVRDSVRSDIINDMVPEMTVKTTRAICDKMIAEATAWAFTTRNEATEWADKTRKEAKERAERTINSAASAIRLAGRQLELA